MKNFTGTTALYVKLCRKALFFAISVTFQVMLTCQLQAQQVTLTARQVIGRIQKNSGAPWQTETVDVFKTGNPDTPVTGIITTMFASFDVLKQAVASGSNLIITHEPTFYNHLDDTTSLKNTGNKVFKEKKAFIDKNGLIIWRFHDHIHMQQPDGIIKGVVHTLGWEKYQDTVRQSYFIIPETSLQDLGLSIKNNLDMRVLRVIGNPAMMVTKVALAPGAPGSDMQIEALERDDVEVLLIGESREWETIEYARDAVAQGRHKALIILGHVPSEESGMEECARWIKTFVSEVPVDYIANGEPYWVVQP